MKNFQQFEASVSPKIGSKRFIGTPLKNVFKSEKKILVENMQGRSGIAMSEENENLRLDLSTKEWFAYEEDYGTSEEKHLIHYINSRIDDLYKQWSELFLIRNEKDLKLFNFKDGAIFMPDYLLLLRSITGKISSYQVFLEPKGGHLEQIDQWKEDFLLQLEKYAQPMDELDNKIEGIGIMGLPFYNESNEVGFNDVFKEKIA